MAEPPCFAKMVSILVMSMRENLLECGGYVPVRICRIMRDSSFAFSCVSLTMLRPMLRFACFRSSLIRMVRYLSSSFILFGLSSLEELG